MDMRVDRERLSYRLSTRVTGAANDSIQTLAATAFRNRLCLVKTLTRCEAMRLYHPYYVALRGQVIDEGERPLYEDAERMITSIRLQIKKSRRTSAKR